MKDYTKNSRLDWSPETNIMTITPAIIDKDKFLYVQEMGVMYGYPTFFTRRDNLPSFELVYTDAGNAYLEYHNRTYHLGPGDFFFIDCMDYHFYAVESEHTWDCRFAHIYGPDIIRQYYTTFVNSAGGHVMHLSSSSKIPMYITSIIKSYQPRRKNSDLIAAMHILQLLTEVVLNAEGEESVDRSSVIQDIAQYIDENYDQAITLDTLSKQFNVSKSYLPKQFKMEVGISPTEYLSHVRIQAAKELLRRTEESVGNVAAMVGIDNVSYFIKLFKKYEQFTPLAFRNKWGKPKDR